MKTVSGKSEAAETADNRHNYGTLEFGQGGGRRRAAVAVAPSCVRPSVRRKERLTPVETFLDCLALASFCRFRFVPFLTFFFNLSPIPRPLNNPYSVLVPHVLVSLCALPPKPTHFFESVAPLLVRPIPIHGTRLLAKHRKCKREKGWAKRRWRREVSKTRRPPRSIPSCTRTGVKLPPGGRRPRINNTEYERRHRAMKVTRYEQRS